MNTFNDVGLPTTQQLSAMLDMQDEINSLIDPAWRIKRHPFLRAVLVEATEAIEHHGWKWWKAQQMDMPQLQMELIDIWHFILAELLIRHGDAESAAEAALSDIEDCHEVAHAGMVFDLATMNTLALLELLIGMSAVRSLHVGVLHALLASCGMTWNDVWRQYLGKNVLNIFRQHNGYKEGTYIKTWGNVEDNVVLVEILDQTDLESPDAKEIIMSSLTVRYSDACKVHA